MYINKFVDCHSTFSISRVVSGKPQRVCRALRVLCLSWLRELHPPFLERLGLLWVRHACCPFASRNLGRSVVIRSHSTYMLLPANHRWFFQSKCTSPRSILGPWRIPWPSKRPTSPTQPLLDSSRSPQRTYMHRIKYRARQYLPCVCCASFCSDAAFHMPLERTDGAGVDIFKLPFWVDAIPRQERSWVILPEGRSPWVRYTISATNCHLTIRVSRAWIGTDPAQMMLGALSLHSTSF